MKENKRLEYKEKVTNTFLKTVSAFSNYQGGQIVLVLMMRGLRQGLMIVSRPVLISKIKLMTL